MRLCPSCQAATPAAAHFCAQCGAALPAEDATLLTSRRQMTVLFCDLVGSTELAQQVDPDDLVAALERYQDTVRRIAARFGGFVARVVGDGVDVYFGYPAANEDDAVRALHTALELNAEVARIEAAPGRPLELRTGLATGMVAVSLSLNVTVAGSTPNLAARIQASMPPGGIGVAPSTRRIGGVQFEFESLGEQALKGFDAPVEISRLVRALGLASRSASRGRDASRPMVGRAAELSALTEQWQSALAGRSCGALVIGEAGLGKSRLVTALDHALPAQGHTLLRLQCSPFHVNSALQPFVGHLVASAGFAAADTTAEQLDKLEAQLGIAGLADAHEHSLIAALLGLHSDGRYPTLEMPPPMRLQLTKEALRHYFAGLARRASAGQQALTRYFTGLAGRRPLLIVIEDMHWIDPTSLEVVDLLLASSDEMPMMLVMTARPEFHAPWPADSLLTVNLQRLADADARDLAVQQARQSGLSADGLAMIVERADGVPLFIEEMTQMLVEAHGRPGAADQHAVPDTLMDLLTARLDRLPPHAKLAAQVASVIGREFDRDLLDAAEPGASGDLRAGLHDLLDDGMVLPLSADGARLGFKHALIENTAYASITPKRCTEWHARIADALLGRFRDRIERHPELAAYHLTRGGMGMRASAWWQTAGAQALSRGAPREAAAHLRAGVQALAASPAGTQRDVAELGLLSMLGPTTMVLLGPGSAEFGTVQERAYGLSQLLPERPRLFPTTYGWCLFNWGRARLATAGQLAQRLLDEAERRPDDTEAAMAANNMAGMVCFHRGAPDAARAHLSRSTSLYEPQRDALLYPVYLMDFGVFGRFYLALATQVLGFADAARRIAAEALGLAEAMNQPHTLGFAMLANFNTALMRGDAGQALPMAERCIEFSSRFGFPEFIAMARIARGWALAHGAQQWEQGLAEVQGGIEGWAQTGFENWQPWFVALEAEILDRLGRQAEALARIEGQLARVAANGERQFEAPLLAERAAALAAVPGRRDEAARVFDAAVALATAQGSPAWVQRSRERRAQTLG